MARSTAAGRLAREEAEFARSGVQSIGADGTRTLISEVAGFTDGVKVSAVGVHGKKARVFRLDGQFWSREFAGDGIETGSVNAFAFRTGVRANKNKYILPGNAGQCRADH